MAEKPAWVRRAASFLTGREARHGVISSCGRVVIDGADYTEYFRAVELAKRCGREAARNIQGLRRLKPITIRGVFDATQSETCCVCHELFVPGPEGVPILSMRGEAVGPVCPLCGVAMIAPEDDA